MNNEPVAWMSNEKEFYVQKNYCSGFIPLYTYPVKEITAEEQRKYFSFELEQQVLTDKEISDTYRLDDHNGITEFARYIESMVIEKLKEKTLTDGEIIDIWCEMETDTSEQNIAFARAILRKAQEK